MPLPWPSQYAGLLPTIKAAWDVRGDVELLSEFGEGKSSARVYLAVLNCRNHSGKAILKLDEPRLWKGEPSELVRHAMAVNNAAHFAENHLPRVIDHLEEGGQTAILQSVAGDLTHTSGLYKLDFQTQSDVLPRIGREVLDDWNSDYVISPAIPPMGLLGEWLGYRLDPKEGRIARFLQDECFLSADLSSFSIEGRWLPNPYAFATNGSLWLSCRELVAAVGHVHGDLHGHNVLLRINGPNDAQYSVIDLGLYQHNSYLFYDHAYLEISHLLHHKNQVDFRRWLEIVDALEQGNYAPELDDQGILVVLRNCRATIQEWIRDKEADREEFLLGQAILARVAAGLNYVNKERLSSQERKLALLYAAASLERYLNLFGVPWAKDGIPVRLDTMPSASPKTEDWRDVWNAAGGFDSHRAAYLLITDPSLRQVDSINLQVLGRVPWAAVIDFDFGEREQSILRTLEPTILRHRAVRHSDPLKSGSEFNFDDATNWFQAVEPDVGPDQLVGNLQQWRRRFLPQVRKLADHVRQFVTPRPIHCVFVTPTLPKAVIISVWNALDEVFREYSDYTFVHSGQINLDSLEQPSNVFLSTCTVGDLLTGLRRMFGVGDSTKQVTIPSREGAKPLSDEDYRYVREDLEVVHASLSSVSDQPGRSGVDFWRGSEITWAELEMYADVPRPESARLKELVREKLEGPRVSELSLQHSAGAGGTTLAKRVAWELKDTYPTVLVHHFSDNTVSRIEQIFHLSTLPVLVVMEESRVPPSSQMKLRNALLGRNVRSCLLTVGRRVSPKGDVRLCDPMEVPDAARFARAYQQYAAPERHSILVRLANDDDMRPYRSPFFFGLFSFEKDFVHVPEFVSFHLEGLNDVAAKVIKYLALVTRFSQTYVTEAELKALFGLSSERPLRLEEVFGDAAARLVLFRNQQARLLHPLIAEEVLRQMLGGPAIGNNDHWRAQLTDLSCQLIDEFADICGAESLSLRELLFQLFIARDFWENEGKRQFSELVLTIPNDAGQHLVLERLVARCPDEAHFWNHLGRHHMYVMKSSYHEAESCLLRAMEADPTNAVHPHALGMVYRFAVQNGMKELAKERVSADTAIRDLQGLAEKAEGCFAKARELDQETEYGYITNIQLISEIIGGLYRLSGCRSYAEFLTSIGDAARWAREKLPKAEELLRRVKSLQSEEYLSYHTKLCDAQIQGIYDQYETMIMSLKRILDRDATQRPAVRRVIAHAMYSHQGHAWHTMQTHELESIEEMMAENLEHDPTNAKDLWMWFQAYRRLRTFNVLEAIDRLSRWAVREASAEAHYYLYILHFLRYREGILDDHLLIHQHTERCKALANQVRRTRCFEWLAKEPSWCPLVHQGELGEWKAGFYEKADLLAEVKGTVLEVKGPQTGTISMGPLRVFFVPGQDILADRDEGKAVHFLLGFSYDGLRGWKAQLDR